MTLSRGACVWRANIVPLYPGPRDRTMMVVRIEWGYLRPTCKKCADTVKMLLTPAYRSSIHARFDLTNRRSVPYPFGEVGPAPHG
jgi:hypothetical protein